VVARPCVGHSRWVGISRVGRRSLDSPHRVRDNRPRLRRAWTSSLWRWSRPSRSGGRRRRSGGCPPPRTRCPPPFVPPPPHGLGPLGRRSSHRLSKRRWGGSPGCSIFHAFRFTKVGIHGRAVPRPSGEVWSNGLWIPVVCGLWFEHYSMSLFMCSSVSIMFISCVSGGREGEPLGRLSRGASRGQRSSGGRESALGTFFCCPVVRTPDPGCRPTRLPPRIPHPLVSEAHPWILYLSLDDEQHVVRRLLCLNTRPCGAVCTSNVFARVTFRS